MKTLKNTKKLISFILTLALLAGLASFGNVGCQTVNAANGTQQDLVSIAASQVGYHEKASNSNLDDFGANSGSANYNKYARDIGVANGQPWCASFIWWCMQTAGVNSNNYPRVTYATRDWFNSRGLWHARGSGYTPKAGDYVAFGNAPDHCGIVESVSGSTVNTIEGNSGDSVKRHSYNLSSTYIMGFGTINFNGIIPPTPTDNPGAPYPIPSGIYKSGSKGDAVKWIQKFANAVQNAGIAEDGIYGNQTAWQVKYFQQTHGLTADAIVGPQTTAKMLEVWRNNVSCPNGFFDDGRSNSAGTITLRGWAYDPDMKGSAIDIHVYIGGCAGTKGAEVKVIKTNAFRDDVNKAFGLTGNHGFDTTITTSKRGVQEVYLYAINVGNGNDNPQIGKCTVNIATPTTEAVTTTEAPTTEEVTTTEEPTTEEVTTTEVSTTEEVTTTEAPTTEEVTTTEEPTTEEVITTEVPTIENLITEQMTGTTLKQPTTEVATQKPEQNQDLEDEEELFEEYNEDEIPFLGKAKMASIKNSKNRALAVRIKKLEFADGYEVYYGALSKKNYNKLRKQINNDCEVLNVSGLKKKTSKSTSFKISKLKKNKKYYVVVRGYVTIDGERYYGEFSKISQMKIIK